MHRPTAWEREQFQQQLLLNKARGLVIFLIGIKLRRVKTI